MAYSADYTSDDLDDVAIDGVAKTTLGIVAFATLIGLLLVALIFSAIWKKMKR